MTIWIANAQPELRDASRPPSQRGTAQSSVVATLLAQPLLEWLAERTQR